MGKMVLTRSRPGPNGATLLVRQEFSRNRTAGCGQFATLTAGTALIASEVICWLSSDNGATQDFGLAKRWGD
jgi:hypothetical protein